MGSQRIFVGYIFCCVLSAFNANCELTYGAIGLAGEASAVGQIKKFTLPTLAQCAVECSVDANCESFGYGFQNHLCLLHNRDFLIRVSSVNLVPDFQVITYYTSICSQTDRRAGQYLEGIRGCVWSPWSRETFNDAVEVCKNNSGRLLDVINQASLDLIYDAIDHGGQKMWVGGVQDDLDPSRWYWLSSSDVISGSNGGQFWIPGNPTNNTAEKCLVGRYQSFYGIMGLVDKDCSEVHKFFCIYE